MIRYLDQQNHENAVNEQRKFDSTCTHVQDTQGKNSMTCASECNHAHEVSRWNLTW